MPIFNWTLIKDEGIPRTHATMTSLSNLPLPPASPTLQHSSFSRASGLSWSVLLLPSACPSHQVGPGQGPSRWLETTSCLTCSPQGLSRNGRAWHQKRNCYLATGPPPSLKILAEMQEQTTQPSSGGLTGVGSWSYRPKPEATTQGVGQGIPCKDHQMPRLTSSACSNRVLSPVCLLSDEKQRLTYKSKSGNRQALAERKFKGLFSCPNVTTFFSPLLTEFYPCLSTYFWMSTSCQVLLQVLLYLGFAVAIVSFGSRHCIQALSSRTFCDDGNVLYSAPSCMVASCG